MNPNATHDLFQVRTWEQFNQTLEHGPEWLLTGDGLWSDSVILIREGCLPRRAEDADTKTQDLGRTNYREAWDEAEGLLPYSLPAVEFWPCAVSLAYAPALLVDQLGRQAWMGYGYLSILRSLAPSVVVMVAPDKAHAHPWRRYVPLVDANGVMVGAVAQMRFGPNATAQSEGCDGPFPTGFMPADAARVKAAQAATAARIAALGAVA